MIEEKPWLVEGAIDFLGHLTFENPDMKVLETGAGGSTLWFSRRVSYVVSLEHSKKWFDKINFMLEHAKIGNVNLIHAPEYPNTGIHSPEKEIYDLILIDGRGRNKSIRTIHPALKPGGYLILDNSERPRYKSSLKFLTNRGWPCIHFIDKWRTSFWKKPKKGE